MYGLQGAEGRLSPGLGQEGFFWFSCHFSNATHIDCQFAENNIPVGNIHTYLQYEHIEDMLT